MFLLSCQPCTYYARTCYGQICTARYSIDAQCCGAESTLSPCSVHCIFVRVTRVKGVGVHPHPHQPGLIFPSWWHVRQKSAIATVCVLCGPHLQSTCVQLLVESSSVPFGLLQVSEKGQKRRPCSSSLPPSRRTWLEAGERGWRFSRNESPKGRPLPILQQSTNQKAFLIDHWPIREPVREADQLSSDDQSETYLVLRWEGHLDWQRTKREFLYVTYVESDRSQLTYCDIRVLDSSYRVRQVMILMDWTFDRCYKWLIRQGVME